MDLKLATLPPLLLLAACASTVDWSKPGVSEAQIDADVRACRLAAASAPTLPRPQTAPPTSGMSSSTGTDLDADRQLDQAQRLESCMRQRGYQLIRK
jgi:hypothetical protein